MEENKMPWGDGTGPEGRGPMTGRGAGFCAGFDRPGYVNCGRGRGRGFGRGRGMSRGFGMRRMAFAEPVYPQPYVATGGDEKSMLEQEAKAIEQEQKALKEELEYIKKKLKELKK